MDKFKRLAEQPLVVATSEAIRLLGGAAGIFDRCVAANLLVGGRVQSGCHQKHRTSNRAVKEAANPAKNTGAQ
jgi:hypothetical protein